MAKESSGLPALPAALACGLALQRIVGDQLSRDQCLELWREQKRNELNMVGAMLEIFERGCYFTPARPEALAMRSAFEAARQKLRGNWEPKG
jgi:hypothetical protein